MLWSWCLLFFPVNEVSSSPSLSLSSKKPVSSRSRMVLPSVASLCLINFFNLTNVACGMDGSCCFCCRGIFHKLSFFSLAFFCFARCFQKEEGAAHRFRFRFRISWLTKMERKAVMEARRRVPELAKRFAILRPYRRSGRFWIHVRSR